MNDDATRLSTREILGIKLIFIAWGAVLLTFVACRLWLFVLVSIICVGVFYLYPKLRKRPDLLLLSFLMLNFAPFGVRYGYPFAYTLLAFIVLALNKMYVPSFGRKLDIVFILWIAILILGILTVVRWTDINKGVRSLIQLGFVPLFLYSTINFGQMSREKIKWLISTGLPILCLVLFVSAVSVLLVILLRVENLSEVIDLNIFRRMAIPDNGSNRLAGLLVFICGFLFCSRQLWSGGFTLRLLLKVTMVGSFLISLFIMSRGAIISFFTMSVAYATGMILGRKKIRVVPIVLSLVVILLVMQPFVINLVDRMKRVKVDYATYFRLAMWGDALLFMQKNPVIGAGPGQYRYQQFEAMKHDDPHNILLRYGVEFGAISSILILVIFVMPIYYFYVCYKKSNVVAVSTYIYLAPPLIGTAVHSMMDYIIPSMSFGPLYWTVWSIAIYLLKNIVKLDDIASE